MVIFISPDLASLMTHHRFTRSLIALLVVCCVAPLAWAIGEQLSESKDELRLKYDLELTDHKSGRVTLTLTLQDQGRLKPLDSIELLIPGEDQTGYVDLSVSLAVQEVEGRQRVRVHLKKELAERAEIQLRTHTLDGRESLRTWYFHTIPLRDHLRKAPAK